MHSKHHDVIFKDKDWGKRHDETNIHEGLLEFFSGRGRDASLVSSTLCRLSAIHRWFSSQRTFHFFASSLLFIYETDPSLEANLQLVMIGAILWGSNVQMY
uniref:Kinase n=1 Tax=Heterorhabditis bacteriophora TaxID=37862 RepID=A0A1I7XDS0_HETBA